MTKRHGKPAALLPHPTDPTVMLVPLTKGYFAAISAVDAETVGRYNWHVQTSARSNTVYGIRSHHYQGEKLLHRFIAGCAGMPLDCEIDHENGNGLDCRRSNLRRATKAQNVANTGLRADNTSGIKGVHFDEATQRWSARIYAAGKSVWLGRYHTKEAAADAMRAARERLHGEFANHGSVH